MLTGRGVAIALRGGTHVATVALVEVSRRTGAVRVKPGLRARLRTHCEPRCVAGNDCSQSGAIDRACIERRVTFEHGNVTSVDWKTYPVARWSDVPEIEVVLLNHPEAPPTGAGEPSSRPTAAAINNAIFDATGVRLRQAPLTAAKIKAALDTKA